MSLYAEYLNEKTNDKIIEEHRGFISYRYLNEQSVYIIDIYVRPEYRREGVGTALADMVCHEAKEKNCKEVLGTVIPGSKNAALSLKAHLGYGMEPHSISNGALVLRKDI